MQKITCSEFTFEAILAADCHVGEVKSPYGLCGWVGQLA